MSYILDALRRADAERERDPARGIHAQPAAGAPARGRAGLPPWTWPALGAVLVAVAAAGWLQQRPAAVPAVTLPARTLAPLPAPAVLPVATTVTPPPPVAPIVEKLRVVAAPAAAARPASAIPAAATPASGAMAAAATPAPAVPAVPAPAADRIYKVAELPADVQQGVPKLAITGGVYSGNAAQRMLIVGGKVVNEGAELAPGVVLDQIGERTAILRFRGYRYSVFY